MYNGYDIIGKSLQWQTETLSKTNMWTAKGKQVKKQLWSWNYNHQSTQ
jgi:hypothetical protein